MRNDMVRAQLRKMPLILSAPLVDSLLEFANADTARAGDNTPSVANDSVMYEKQGNIAIISVDGAMYKKDISGMCMSVASYDTMVKFYDKAENDPEIETIVSRVDTGGGSVAGADEVEDRIYKSKKKTITFYENTGASGGLWVFMASDEVYATQSTMLGSIGVVVSYLEEDEETGKKRVEIVSKRATNKRCSLNGTCKEEIQSVLDTYEEMFYERIEKNTGFNAEMIGTTFNNGGMIFAKEALNAGFIQGITTFDDLMSNLKMGTNPLGASATIQIENNSKKESKLTIEEQLTKAQTDLSVSLEANASLTEKLEKTEAKVTDLEGASTENMRVAEAKAIEDMKTRVTVAKNIVALAFDKGATKDVAVEMIEKDSIESASVVLLDKMGSVGSTTPPLETEAQGADTKLDERCEKLGVQFV